MLPRSLLLLQLNRGLQSIAIIFLHTPNSFSDSEDRLREIFLKSADRSDSLFTIRRPLLHLTARIVQAILAQTNNRLKLLFPRELNTSRAWYLSVSLQGHRFIHVLLVQADRVRRHLLRALALLEVQTRPQLWILEHVAAT